MHWLALVCKARHIAFMAAWRQKVCFIRTFARFSIHTNIHSDHTNIHSDRTLGVTSWICLWISLQPGLVHCDASKKTIWHFTFKSRRIISERYSAHTNDHKKICTAHTKDHDREQNGTHTSSRRNRHSKDQRSKENTARHTQKIMAEDDTALHMPSS